ncbi:kinetochore protein SPC25 homolog [Mercurialis annua]|uniref:kinetochore protein SPC25 homolog n=1 Tax=Mercurialis annua TaxID=3986 RepID=UPI00215E83CA|nr:kinetochore protein SPC25 homolog [Mercurialis annua]
MESLRLSCEREVAVEMQKIDSFTASFSQSMDSIKSTAEQTLQNQEKLGKLKSSLREAEADFVKVLAVKTRKEAKQIAIREAISATRDRVEELKRTLEIQRARRDQYAAIISHESLDEDIQGIKHKIEETQEGISWYNKVLGFHIKGGRGVKFTFNNIDMRNPHKEYTLTVCHEDDTYTLLACDPHLSGTKELIDEMNKTNGLFKFVRTMREKFQAIPSLGISPQSNSLHQECTTVSASAPVMSTSTEISESPTKENEYPREEERQFKKVNLGSGIKNNLEIASHRRSPRLVKRKK